MNRKKLETFERELRDDIKSAQPTLSPDLATFVADALGSYLSGEAPTLDKAFGLHRGRGRPVAETPDATLDRVDKALGLHGRGWTWEDIGAEIGERDVMEASAARRLVERHSKRAAARMAQRLANRMREKNSPGT